WRWARAASLNEAGIPHLSEIGDLLDPPDLQQQIGCFLVEGMELAREKGPVGGTVLPAQILCRVAELLARLLHVRAHDLVGFLLVGPDPFAGIEMTFTQR